MLASSITSINPAWFTPLGGIIGGVVGYLGYQRLRRNDRQAREFLAALQQDELLGHKNIPGVPDKPSLSERHAETNVRLTKLEIDVSEMARELHPNGGSSMLDTVNKTHRLAEDAAINAAEAARVLAERERMRVAGEVLLRDRIRQHPEMRELNELLNVLPPPTEGI